MADIITTLHPEKDLFTDLYPNIKKENIPTDAIDTYKMKDRSVTLNKLNSDVIDYIDNQGKPTQEQVNKWLDEHPSATTTVDYSITTKVYGNITQLENDSSLSIGDKCKTLGYYAENDGGSAYYIIKNAPSGIYETLNNGLYAELIVIDSSISILQVGAKKNDSSFDNSSILIRLLNFCNKKSFNIIVPSGDFYFQTPISINELWYMNIYGNANGSLSNTESCFIYIGVGTFMTFTDYASITIEKISFKGNNTNNLIVIKRCTTSHFNQCTFSDHANGIILQSTAYVYFYNCRFYCHANTTFCIRLGDAELSSGLELTYLDECIFDSAFSAKVNFIEINGMADLRVTNCDFANTLGSWVKISNQYNYDLHDLVFIGCNFTRAKEGFKIDLNHTDRYLSGLIIDKCFFSVYGLWEDGEKIFDLTLGSGNVDNSKISNCIVRQQYNDFIPDYFLQCNTQYHKIAFDNIIFPNIIGKYQITKSLVSYNLSRFTINSNFAKENGFEITDINGIVHIIGRLKNPNGNVSAYTEILTIDNKLLYPIGNELYEFLAFTRSGSTYPCYIENGIMKCRIQIPQNTELIFNLSYPTY